MLTFNLGFPGYGAHSRRRGPTTDALSTQFFHPFGMMDNMFTSMFSHGFSDGGFSSLSTLSTNMDQNSAGASTVKRTSTSTKFANGKKIVTKKWVFCSVLECSFPAWWRLFNSKPVYHLFLEWWKMARRQWASLRMMYWNQGLWMENLNPWRLQKNRNLKILPVPYCFWVFSLHDVSFLLHSPTSLLPLSLFFLSTLPPCIFIGTSLFLPYSVINFIIFEWDQGRALSPVSSVLQLCIGLLSPCWSITFPLSPF